MSDGIKFEFKMAQETIRFLNRLRDSPPKFEKAMSRASQKVSVEYAFRVKKAILQQTDASLSPPLSESWLKIKRKKGYDLRKWVATYDYFNSIRPEVTGTTGAFGHQEWGVRAMGDRANQLENGDMMHNRPPRPHWMPVLRRMNGFINVTMREEVMGVLASR